MPPTHPNLIPQAQNPRQSSPISSIKCDMLEDLLKRGLRSLFVTDSFEQELYWILVIFKWLLILFLIMFGLWSVLFLIQDLLWLSHLYQNGFESGLISNLGSGISNSYEFNTKTLMKTLLLGTVAFVVPRLLWSWFSRGISLQSAIKRQMNPENGDNSSELLPDPNLLIPASIDEPTYISNKYQRILGESEDWVKNQLRFPPRLARRIFLPSRKRIEKLQDIMKKFKQKTPSKLNIFVMGRKGSGKSTLIRALNGNQFHSTSSSVAYVGEHGEEIRKFNLKISNGSYYADVYELPSVIPDAQTERDTLNSFSQLSRQPIDVWPRFLTILDFLMKMNVLPDLILTTHRAKELQTIIGLDLKILRCLLWHINCWFLCSFNIPIIGVPTHADTVYPFDLKLPSEFDDEKWLNLQNLENIYMQAAELNANNGMKLVWEQLELLVEDVIPVTSTATYRKIDNGNHYEIIKDYRFNIDKLLDSIIQHQSWSLGLDHVPFAVNLVEIFKTIAQHLFNAPVDVSTKYQMLVYMVSIISLELSSSPHITDRQLVPTFDPRDPRSFVEGVKDFWLTLGVGNITYHSIKTLASELMESTPFGQIFSASVAAGSGISLGLENVTERLGMASVAYFANRLPKNKVSKIFSGEISY